MDTMLEQALKSHLPFIHVRTDDILHVEEVLSFIAGEEVRQLIQQPDGTLGNLQANIYYTSEEIALPKTYMQFKDKGKTLVFVNTKPSVLHFVGGVMFPPKAMQLNYLRDLMEDAENAEAVLPAFGGMTLKEMFEAVKLTHHRTGAITAKTINETRKGYISRLKGIVQVDTAYDFYQSPSYLETYLKANSTFFTNPVLPSLTPRGLLFDGSPGCLDGGTMLTYKRGKRGGGRAISLSSLYRRFNGLPDGRNPPRLKNAPTYLPSMQEDGSLHYNRIISIIEAGVKNCIRIVTKAGNSITLTPDHPVCTVDGDFVPAGSLVPGSMVRIKGSMIPTGTNGKKKRVVHRKEICVKHHPVAGTKIVNGYAYKRLHLSRVVIEAHMNKLMLSEYIQRLNLGNLEGMMFLKSSQEVHHIDENPRNDALCNLVVMDKEAHAKHHGKLENFKVEYTADDEVVLVVTVGPVMTYDVQMNMPCHNFEADNFIVHNTGKSAGSKYIAEHFDIPLYHLDVGAIKGKYVGDSEGNLNAALAQVDQMAPCVLLIDEIEKVFASQNDSGVTSSLLGTLLWWLQEHKSQVFTIMTTNNRLSIPKELYREGRIDEVMVFQGLETQTQAMEFALSVYESLSIAVWKEIKPLPKDALATLTSNVKLSVMEKGAIPQAKVVQIVQSMFKSILCQ
jgi:hypothetical protein